MEDLAAGKFQNSEKNDEDRRNGKFYKRNYWVCMIQREELLPNNEIKHQKLETTTTMFSVLFVDEIF